MRVRAPNAREVAVSGQFIKDRTAHYILDNLIAQKKARPMVVVMPDAHALPPIPNAGPGRGLGNSGPSSATCWKRCCRWSSRATG